MSTQIIPDFQDEVIRIDGDVSGVVDATYVKNGVTYLDVAVDTRMYCKTPAANWEVTTKYKE